MRKLSSLLAIALLASGPLGRGDEVYSSDDGTSVQTEMVQPPIRIQTTQPEQPEVVDTGQKAKARPTTVSAPAPAAPKAKPVQTAQKAEQPSKIVKQLEAQIKDLESQLKVAESATKTAPPAREPVQECTKTGPPIKDSYEPVASDQANSIAGRLRIAQDLILRYGRAYDYRGFTTGELQEILDRLDVAQFDKDD